MSWGAIAGAAIGVVGSAMSNRSAGKGADAAAGAQYAAIDEQRRQYDQTREDQAPWLAAGRDALGQYQQLLANPDSIQDSAAYQWRLGQGMQTLDRSAAARGGLFNGGHSADLMRFGQGEASQEYANQGNRLAALAGVGQTTAQGLGALGANMAGNVGNALGNVGNIRQSQYQQQGWNNAQAFAGVGGAFNNWYQGNKANNPGGTGWYLGNNPGRG